MSLRFPLIIQTTTESSTTKSKIKANFYRSFTTSIDTAMKAYKEVDGSAIMVNDHTAFRVDWMPFAGLKESGLGIGGISHTIKDMQVEKMLVLHSAEL
ncbi:MAG: aldehyde dehydrogenase family protein [Desulfobulbaceae bacterium]|nr:aldehyde dehydrogenase family protein [Desulfobulbaceae bacterium]